MRLTAGAEEEVPVLIVGGGGAGLTASMLLVRLGVEHLLGCWPAWASSICWSARARRPLICPRPMS
jgi:hypothetical protein